MIFGCAQEGISQTGATSSASSAPDDLAQRLKAAVAAKGPDYRPRTEHLRADGSPVYTNRLILEDSPYLIQHAHNPVNWFPWGEEAFSEAERLGRPIFLSIGYSTCHWCHVMETESFENEDVARYLNEHFVSIKVDREQRPDVDEVYMTALQLMGQRGGWPMSSFLTSAGDPFYGGTYFPRDQFLDLLTKISNLWASDRPRALAGASQVAETLQKVTSASEEAAQIDEALLTQAVKQTLQAHDDNLGGFSGSPKFPSEPELLFLLERLLREDDPRALKAVDTTLDHMARGGIYDQVGGGFHRYSTDARWLVPHFEKMLYNQAHLARVYLEAWRLTGNAVYERTARQTLDYVLRDMTSPEGGFYSATDADSEGREGEFFVWTPDQIRAALSAAALPDKSAELAMRVFGVSEKGNFEGKNILHLDRPWPKTAADLGMPLDDLFTAIDRIRARLYEVREMRIHPLRDEKIVTAWNAMMVTTLAGAGRDLDEPRYAAAATRAAEFLWRENRRPDGRLWRANLDGSASVDATLNDYAYLAEAFLTLFDVTEQPQWKERAVATADVTMARFGDPAGGGFFLSEGDHGGRLPARPKSPTDGAIPSGNSVALRVLALLAERTGEPRFRRQAEATLAAFSGGIRRQPRAFSYMLLGADELLHGGAGPLEYGGGGAVRAEASIDGDEVRVKLTIADGWHINSNEPLQEDLIATRLESAGDEIQLAGIEFPKATEVHLAFRDEALAVFAGTQTIGTRLVKSPSRGEGPKVVRLRLKMQACDEQKCLWPEELILELVAR